jgi:D-arabinose 1-dehydrogenase-like Zn-dependent alcohol dehydrogenase
MKLTKHGLDGGIDTVGGKMDSIASKCLKRGAKLIVYGLLSLNNKTPIDTDEMIFKGTMIKGFWLTR